MLSPQPRHSSTVARIAVPFASRSQSSLTSQSLMHCPATCPHIAHVFASVRLLGWATMRSKLGMHGSSLLMSDARTRLLIGSLFSCETAILSSSSISALFFILMAFSSNSAARALVDSSSFFFRFVHRSFVAASEAPLSRMLIDCCTNQTPGDPVRSSALPASMMPLAARMVPRRFRIRLILSSTNIAILLVIILPTSIRIGATHGYSSLVTAAHASSSLMDMSLLLPIQDAMRPLVQITQLLTRSHIDSLVRYSSIYLRRSLLTPCRPLISRETVSSSPLESFFFSLLGTDRLESSCVVSSSVGVARAMVLVASGDLDLESCIPTCCMISPVGSITRSPTLGGAVTGVGGISARGLSSVAPSRSHCSAAEYRDCLTLADRTSGVSICTNFAESGGAGGFPVDLTKAASSALTAVSASFICCCVSAIVFFSFISLAVSSSPLRARSSNWSSAASVAASPSTGSFASSSAASCMSESISSPSSAPTSLVSHSLNASLSLTSSASMSSSEVMTLSDGLPPLLASAPAGFAPPLVGAPPPAPPFAAFFFARCSLAMTAISTSFSDVSSGWSFQ